MQYVIGAKKFYQFHRACQRTPVWKHLKKQFSMPLLQVFRFLRAEIAVQFASRCPRKEAAAHSNAAMNAPAVNWHVSFRKRLLPGKHMSIHRINQRTVKINDKRAHINFVIVRHGVFGIIRLKTPCLMTNMGSSIHSMTDNSPLRRQGC